MKGQSYVDELAGVVALPCLMDCSLVDFARRIRVHIKSELSKISPDNSLIALLADAARLGWEQIEWCDAYVLWLEARAALGAQPATEAAGEPSAVQQLQAAIALLIRWMDHPDQDLLLADTDRFVRSITQWAAV